MQQVNLGMLGGGTVGSGVFHALQLNGGLMSSRIGVKVNIRKVAVKAFDEPRPYPIGMSYMTTDWQSVVNDPEVDIVIELVGGTTLARTMVMTALKLGKPVITANKALLSAHGEELFAAAQQHGTNLYYEASVCGGIPIIKSLREGFVGNRITHLYGIVNGTCNYILTRMKLEGADFDSMLKDAQTQGYAEAEPSLDIDGFDAQHKVGILASLAHGFWVKPEEIHVEGIRHISALDIKFAQQLGYTIKLLGIIKAGAKRGGPGTGARIQASVYPTLVPNSHVLASVNHVFNAVFVRGDVVGDTLFYGRGAGKDATASAVLSDVADAALDLKFGTKHRVPPFVPHERNGAVAPIEEISSRYFIRLNVVDVPGTLGKITNILGAAKIGISSVIQPEGHEGASVPLILMLHDAPNGVVTKALKKIAQLSVVKGTPVLLRVESLNDAARFTSTRSLMLIVQKYGGTSVANPARIKNVAERVAKYRAKGDKIVVVVSAMSGVTDNLIKLARELMPLPDEREMDVLLATGEQTTIALTAIALHAIGIPAVSLTGAQAGIVTDGVHTKAKIQNITPKRTHDLMNQGNVVIVAGFQGETVEGQITTLGRGGSDLTAIALAAALKADLCQIYTDVDGVYTADPRIVPTAQKLDEISYDEMLELASLGAKVMQSRSVEFAKKFGVVFEVRSSLNENPGTIVKEETKSMEGVVVRGVSLDKNQAKVTLVAVPDKPGVAAHIFKAIGDANVNVDMIVQNISHGSGKPATDLSFTVDKPDLLKAQKVIEALKKDIGFGQVIATENIGKLSIVGVGMKSHSGVAGKMFDTLAKEGVNIDMISTSEIKISVVIDLAKGEHAMKAVHAAFLG